MDTTSSALARTLHLLADHPEVQQRLRQELQESSQGEDLPYDVLHKLPYLDAVCRETLRLCVFASESELFPRLIPLRLHNTDIHPSPPSSASASEHRRFSVGTALIKRVSRAKKDTVLPFSAPIHMRDGTVLQEIAVPRGTTALISIHTCNRNKALWGEDAEEWKPERWLQPLRPELEKTTIPGVYSNLYVLRERLGRCCC